jgi:hypothetical protein
MSQRLPKLPALVQEKLTKTGYTRGASMKEIYQNRVTRNNPVLIPWTAWEQCKMPDDGTRAYENGFIVLVEPSWYFREPAADAKLRARGLEIGRNALLVFRRRSEWDSYSPPGGHLSNGLPFVPASSRRPPLRGVYIARIHATVAEAGDLRLEGFDSKHMRGAGIRVYEYASSDVIRHARLQLEALIWQCHDALECLTLAGMTPAGAKLRRDAQIAAASAAGLLERDRLITARILGEDSHTMCPLCRQPLSAAEFLRRSSQAVGRETHDLTSTEVSLFHIQELRVGRFQHKPYNLGWGHHFCNVVVKDSGILPTLKWMRDVLANQLMSQDLEAEAALVEHAVDS